MKQLLPTRTLVRFLGIASVVAACSRSEQADTTDSSAAADTARIRLGHTRSNTESRQQHAGIAHGR